MSPPKLLVELCCSPFSCRHYSSAGSCVHIADVVIDSTRAGLLDGAIGGLGWLISSTVFHGLQQVISPVLQWLGQVISPALQKLQQVISPVLQRLQQVHHLLAAGTYRLQSPWISVGEVTHLWFFY